VYVAVCEVLCILSLCLCLGVSPRRRWSSAFLSVSEDALQARGELRVVQRASSGRSDFGVLVEKAGVQAAHGAQGTQDGAGGRIAGSLRPRNQFSTSVTQAGVGSPYRRLA